MTDDLKDLEKEAEELRQNLWVWKGISFLLLVLYLVELGGWFSEWRRLACSAHDWFWKATFSRSVFIPKTISGQLSQERNKGPIVTDHPSGTLPKWGSRGIIWNLSCRNQWFNRSKSRWHCFRLYWDRYVNPAKPYPEPDLGFDSTACPSLDWICIERTCLAIYQLWNTII